MKNNIQFTNNPRSEEGVRKYNVNRSIAIGPVSLKILTIASLASLLLLYLAQTTQGATKSYEVQSMEQDRQELVEDVERLKLESQRLQALSKIEASLGEDLEKDFEEVDEIKTLAEAAAE